MNRCRPRRYSRPVESTPDYRRLAQRSRSWHLYLLMRQHRKLHQLHRHQYHHLRLLHRLRLLPYRRIRC